MTGVAAIALGKLIGFTSIYIYDWVIKKCTITISLGKKLEGPNILFYDKSFIENLKLHTPFGE